MASGIRQTNKCGGPGQIGLPTRRSDLYKRTKNEIKENNGNYSIPILSEIMMSPPPSQMYVVRRREELLRRNPYTFILTVAHFLIP